MMHKSEDYSLDDLMKQLRLKRKLASGTSVGLVSTNKFDKGGFKMELKKGRIVISKTRRYVRRAKNYLGMYHLSLSEEGSASTPSVESGDFIVENVSFVSINDVTNGMIANVNDMNFSGYFVCSISLWHKRLAHTNVKTIEKNAN
uniref:Uncharacterized protein n=1 Tax=Lactuca sativa TaxID=4236 RepID=A0A9R1VMX0_LACSA|nr:hypothetical protein LSAT_V11C400209040 [Lactuca sativa]